MSRLRQLISEVHRRSLWQVLLVYAGASWAVFTVVQTLTEGLGLPEWFPAFALVLLLVGLPIVLATAFLQEGISPARRHDPTLMPGGELEADAGPGEVAGARRLFTWRNAVSGGVLALAIWGVVATGWYVLYGGANGSPSLDRKSVAVLPFVNVSASSEDEYFSDGITFEIINRLSKIADLKVISRTSIMQYKGTTKNIREIGDELDVAAVVEGEVLRAEDRVRINAQLIDAQTDEHLWAEHYNRELTDVFEIQSDVALQIAAALRAELAPAEIKRIDKKPTEDLEAYNFYLLGRFYWNKRTEEGLRQAIGYFERAIEEDSSYALAYVGLADCYNLIPYYGGLLPKETFPKARAAALKALQIDSTLGEAHTSLGFVMTWYDWDWSAAEIEFKRAIELNPGYATAHQWYAIYLMAMAKLDKAVTEMRRARELDPLSLIITTEVGLALFFARQYDRAIEEYRKAIVLDPNFALAHSWLGLAYVQKAMFVEAIAECQEAVTLSGGNPSYVANLAAAYAGAGKSSEALALLNKLKERARREYISPILFALVYGALGEKDQALEWLEKAYAERDGWLSLLKVDPTFDSLRSEPRFEDLLRRMDFPE